MADYKSIYKVARDEIIINKSRFIASACPVETEEEAVDFIDSIKKEFKEASHNVYAYVLGVNSNIQRYSDDGEPSGTAGLPVLNVINQEKLKNLVIVVTRYFGGVLLGAGGLVRAYTRGAKIAIDNGIIVEKKKFYHVEFSIDYTLLGRMDNELFKNNFRVIDKNYQERVFFNLISENENLQVLRDLVSEISGGKEDIVIGQAEYFSINNGKILELQ